MEQQVLTRWVCKGDIIGVRGKVGVGISQRRMGVTPPLLRLGTRSPTVRQFSGCFAAREPSIYCATQAHATAPITFHVGETSLTVPFSAQAARGLKDAIGEVLTTFQEKEKATRPRRWNAMEYKLAGADGVWFEFFCNPNAHANAFQAKVLITIDDCKIKVTSEGLLSALKSDLDQYVEPVL